ncbi:MAG: insulinase family protein [Myxococcales bacterium]|nr:insulinase family protein [Myxococcales bacterium]
MPIRRHFVVPLLIAAISCGSPQTKSTTTTTTATTTAAPKASAGGAAANLATTTQPSSAALGTLPVDGRIRTGKLSNGLTYYILPHKKPEKRALLWLAVNAGSVLEDDDQRGLAHFLEHMAFNGTKRFKKLAIVNFIERIGMRFGADLNAYTSFDQTVYQLQVPTDDEKLLSQGFVILSEWASAIAFEPSEVESERGVVLEEWRKGLGASKRVLNQQLPVLLKGSRYAERLPIGKPKIIKTAPRSALTRFYADWYRPDLMAVVVVGDIDRDDIEKRIVATFGGLKNPAKPRPRPVAKVPTHAQTLVTTTVDKELDRTVVQLVHKMPHRELRTEQDYRRSLLERLYAAMLNERFGEIRTRKNAPFLGAFAGLASWVRTMDAFVLYAAVQGQKVDAGVRALAEEVERINRHGFTAAELIRAKKKLLRTVERAVAMRDKRNSRVFAKEILRYHFSAEAMPGVERELKLTQRIMAKVGLSDVNGLAKGWIHSANRVIAISAPAGAKVPKSAELIALATPKSDSEIGPWVEKKTADNLMAKLPKPGKVTAARTLPKLGVTVWTLSNGAKVWIKPTQFKNDEVRFVAVSPGGHSLASDAQFHSAQQAAKLAALGGVGAHDQVALGKVLAGRVVSVTPYISDLNEGLKGHASPKDLEALLQLAHLRFVAPRTDKEAFDTWHKQQTEALKNRGRSPRRVFFDKFSSYVSKNHLRRQPPSLATLAKVDLARAMAFYKERFENAGDFSFVFVGNVNPKTLKPLVERYLASLPAVKKREKWKDVGITRLSQGQVTVRKGVEPTAFVLVYFTFGLGKKMPWSLDLQDDAKMLSGALRIRLREVLREKMAGVYGVGARSSISRYPEGRATTFVAFGCAPDNVPALKKAVLDVIAEVQTKGVSDEIVAKLKAMRSRQFEVKSKDNRHWIGELKTHIWHGTNPERILQSHADRVTSARIQSTAKRLITKDTFVFGQLLPQAAAGLPAKAPKMNK